MASTQGDRVKQLFRDNPTKWFTTLEVREALPEVSSHAIYLSLSNFTLKDGFLLRRSRGSANEYGLNPAGEAASAPSRQVKSRSPRIDWSPVEREALAREIVRLRRADNLTPLSMLIYQAQKNVIADGRRRDIKYANSVPWLIEMVEKYKAEPAELTPQRTYPTPAAETAQVAEPDQATPVEPTPPQVASTDLTPSEIQKYGEILKEVVEGKKVLVDPDYLKQLEDKASQPAEPPPASIENFGADAILGEVTNRIGSFLGGILASALNTPEIRQALTVTINHQHLHHHTHDKVPTADEVIESERRAEDRPPRPKIGVVGNRTDFEQQLRQSFPHIQFTVTAREMGTAAEKVKNCDKVLVMTKFIGHQTNHHVKKAIGDKYVAVNGGTAEMIRVLNMMISSGQISKS